MSSPSLERLEQTLIEARAALLQRIRGLASREEIAAASDTVRQAHAALMAAAAAEQAPVAETAVLPATLTGHLFANSGSAESTLRPEQAAARPRVGLCFSGGGTRAASCSMGALRGLRALGLLDRVDYLSTVSGGGWAGSIFSYAAIDEAVLVGPDVPNDRLGSLTWETGAAPFNLADLDTRAIGHFCTRLGWESLVEGAVKLYFQYPTLAFHQYWPRLIGKQVLEPYGLGDALSAEGRPQRFYSFSADSFPFIVGKLNPTLSAENFHFSRAGTPLWVANSTFNVPGPNPEPYPLWISQLDVGIYPRFQGAAIGGGVLGGGSIDPFAFGSQAPLSTADGRFTVATPQPFALSDAAGTSSAAFGVELFARLPNWLKGIIGEITPLYDYWTVANTGQPAGRYEVSDGAGLDNQALLGLLGWAGPESILCFVNTDEALIVNPLLPPSSINSLQMDTSVPPLFGWIWDSRLGAYRPVNPGDGNAALLQVFPSALFSELVQQLRNSIAGGGAALAKLRAQTVANARFGIEAGRTVQVLFVFNHHAPAFWNALEWEIRTGLALQYPLVTFPYFDTVRDLNLSAQAVNLLAAQMAWNLKTRESLVRSMFGPIT
jgi:hypothetical protein